MLKYLEAIEGSNQEYQCIIVYIKLFRLNTIKNGQKMQTKKKKIKITDKNLKTKTKTRQIEIKKMEQTLV